MDKQNKFDQEISEKLGMGEAEPSAQVWANVRGNIKTGNGENTALLLYRVALAACIALLIGLSILFTQSDNEKSEMRLTGLETGTFKEMAQAQKLINVKNSVDSVPNSPSPGIYSPAQIQGHMPQIVVKAHETPLKNKNKQLSPLDKTLLPQELIAEQIQPLRTGQDRPVITEVSKINPSENRAEIAKSHYSRELPSPTFDENNMQNIAPQSTPLFASITRVADDYLGMDTNYEEDVNQNVKETKFRANLGFFKIKRVRKTKI